MVTIYGYFILLDFTLLAIIIAIYVLSATMLGAAKSIAESQLKIEAERHIKQNTDNIKSVETEIQKLSGNKDQERLVEALREKLKQLETEKGTNSHNLESIRRTFLPLTLKHSVLIPGILILVSIIAISIASYGATVSWHFLIHFSLFVIGMVAVIVTVALMYGPLHSIQSIALSTEKQSQANLINEV
jgi:hypothetical protein